MRELQRQTALERDLDDPIDGQQIRELAEILERRTVHILHDDITEIVELLADFRRQRFVHVGAGLRLNAVTERSSLAVPQAVRRWRHTSA